MKRTVAIALILASVGAYACQGQPMGHGKDGHPRMGLMAMELNLTADQKSKIKEIRKASRNQHFELMDQMEELRDSTETKMLAVLDDEQKTKFLKMRKEKLQHRMYSKGQMHREHGKMGGSKQLCDKE
jgi:Spy/CpxP family protein refolding chaperone